MSSTGLLVTAWPFVLGCDAAGEVVEVGNTASSIFKVGDQVCGCTRLGVPGHSTAQEFVRHCIRSRRTQLTHIMATVLNGCTAYYSKAKEYQHSAGGNSRRRDRSMGF